MKHSFKRLFAAALAAAALTASLAGCSKTVQLRYKDGVFTSGKLSYVPASGTYEPTSQGDEYAYYKNGNITLYAIGKNDPTLWLTENYAGGATTVFHAPSITLPTLSELNAEKILVCSSDVTTVAVCEITDKALIDRLVQTFTEGEACEWPLVGATLDYELKFYSSAWPQIYMNLIYGEFEEGVFVYERATRRCVEIGDLLAGELHPDENG